ncbi:hypothetical protein OCGS_1381 [Oceaniovalibus guishaninsula JLT2003]|uniref:Uncharacterized protein n=1 Tax=Oceaniovalibus guishaninsula JLT2003 TaxID=1231392 RepID=K2HAI6_9RHOB|nr:hypothetical protein [Oceaniovalibus guishaninsula]EKE44543.1 hypothetical protein OCGS_1381 [Oceaniovalibus guishaninsula JLT2003]
MVYWSFITFTVALTAGLVGFGGEPGELAVTGQGLFFVFLVVSAVLLLLKMMRDG